MAPENPLGEGPPPRRSSSSLLLVAACLPFLAVLVYQVNTSLFLCDDAFISFRYARNLMEGHGLVFNRGEYVEGYTNLLWVLELAGIWALGLRPETAAHLLSMTMTAGTLAVVVGFAQRESERWRSRIVWLAFGLVACSASFAVWSTSGLETRQFTSLVVLGVFVLTRTPTSMPALVFASVVFAAAELTRPEGLLVFACALVWRLLQDQVDGQLRRGRVVSLLAPFVVVVASHYVWRYCYYGDWLPNTYYAKHVRAWYESGFIYCAAAAIELGAWLWGPLACVAVVRRTRARDLAPMLPLALVALHAMYVMRIGGDHFEYRPFDFYLPLLAVPAAKGLVHVVERLSCALSPSVAKRATWANGLAAAAYVPLLVYCHALGAASIAEPRAPEVLGVYAHRLERDSWVQLVPGLPPLCTILGRLREGMYHRFVAFPARLHAEFARGRIANYATYERLRDGAWPNDAAMAEDSVGVLPFYVPDLSFVDLLGLTDATVARTSTNVDNSMRVMAHDRHPPPGYLRQRGVNVAILPLATTELEALQVADFALKVDDDVWLPLRANDREYVQRSFPSDRLAVRHRVDSSRASANQILIDGVEYVGERLLSTFEPGEQGLTWTCTGCAAVRSTHELLMACVGTGQLSTEQDGQSAIGQGSARSSEFTAEHGVSLVMFLAGQRALGLEVNVLCGGQVVRSLSPRSALHVEPVALPLDAWVGRVLSLEVVDRGAGWLVLDHVLLARQGSAARAVASVAWSRRADPLLGLLRIAPLRSVRGEAVSGGTTVSVINPLPDAVGVTFELVEGPLDACFLTGPWVIGDKSGVNLMIPSGATAQMQAFLHVPVSVPLARHDFTIRIRVRSTLANSSTDVDTMVLERVLKWEERN
ncbi:MAG: hypothetical protein ABIP94_24040 [Planctomycetota bacterium]